MRRPFLGPDYRSRWTTQPLARLQLVKWGTNPGNGDSYAWWCRPQLVQIANGNAPLLPYSPGSDSALLNGALASISNLNTVTSNGTFASASTVNNLNAQVNNPGGLAAQINSLNTVTSNGTFASASSFNSLNAQINNGGGVAAQASAAYSASQDSANKLSNARISLAATAGDGRAQFTLSSDGHDGRWELVGDGRINGNLTVDGTLTTSKVGDNQITNGDFVINNNTYNGLGGVTAVRGGYSVQEGQYYNSGDGAYENYPGWTTLLDNTYYNLPGNTRVDVVSTFKQDCTVGTAWCCRMLINGNLVDDSWGQAAQDKLMLMGSQVIGGSVRIQIQWAANSNAAVNPKMKVMWTYK